MSGDERSQSKIRERIAVHNQERLDADDVERLARSTCRTEDQRLLPRIARADAQVAPVSDH